MKLIKKLLTPHWFQLEWTDSRYNKSSTWHWKTGIQPQKSH